MLHVVVAGCHVSTCQCGLGLADVALAASPRPCAILIGSTSQELRLGKKGPEKGTEQLSCDHPIRGSVIKASRIRALRITSNLRMAATMATLAALPREKKVSGTISDSRLPFG